MNDEQAFRAAIADDRWDYARHAIFADWLDEQGRYDEATYQRAWTKERQEVEDAGVWLRDFADKAGMNYDDVLTAGKRFMVPDAGEVAWGTGGNFEPENILHKNVGSLARFWECIELVVGQKLPDQATREIIPFQCCWYEQESGDPGMPRGRI